MSTRIAIVGCGKTKAASASPARQLYTGNLFRLSLQHAERTCDRVYIASAQYDLVEPDQVIKPYERRITDLGGKKDRAAWGSRVVGRIPIPGGCARPTLLVYAGSDYAEPLRSGAWWHGWPVELPLRGLQIGQRLQWLKADLARKAA